MLCIGFLFALQSTSYSQIFRTPVTTTFTRLNAYSALRGDAFSFASNQAALSSVKNVSAGIYSERRFLLKEMSLYTAAVAMPTASGNFGCKADYSGDASYNETGLALAYGRSLGNKISVGVQFNYYSIKIAGYGKASCVNAEAGILVHLTESLHTGIHVYNPTGTTIGKSGEEKLPGIYSAGLGYDVSEKLFIGMEIQKQEDEPAMIQAGLQYHFDEKLMASAGIISSVAAYYFGFGTVVKNIKINAVASIHPQLGLSPGLLLVFNPSKKSE